MFYENEVPVTTSAYWQLFTNFLKIITGFLLLLLKNMKKYLNYYKRLKNTSLFLYFIETQLGQRSFA